MTENCIFCKVVKNEIPRQMLYETEEVLVFLNIKPLSPGHALVVPKKHFSSLQVIPPAENDAVMNVVQKVALPLAKAAGAESYNLILNNDVVAGQSIPHLHWHIIPRTTQDGLFDWEQFGTREYADGEWESYGEQIRTKLSDL